MDQSKKTMRHFYCRDVLWETFEQMANDFDCSIDYLINEAMRGYARSKNYASAMANSQPPPSAGAPGYGGFPPQPHAGAPMAQPGPMPGPGAAPAGARRTGAPPPPPMGGPGRGGPPMRPQPATGSPPNAAGGMPVGGMGGGPGLASPGPGPMPGQMQGQMPGQMPGPGMQSYGQAVSGASTLYLIYNSQRYPITKDQFIIGRGSKTSDLPIKDGNISRKHAAVIRRNGTYYIKDLGSTNGIDYKGMRIDNKRIDEGDVFHLCDYELRFTYRPD